MIDTTASNIVIGIIAILVIIFGAKMIFVFMEDPLGNTKKILTFIFVIACTVIVIAIFAFALNYIGEAVKFLLSYLTGKPFL